MPVLVDTSSWIEALRERGRAEVRERVMNLVDYGDAAWCHVIRLELWNGIKGDVERKQLGELESYVTLVPTDETTWTAAIELAKKARASGVNAPIADMIVAACAKQHKLDLETCDAHFTKLMSI